MEKEMIEKLLEEVLRVAGASADPSVCNLGSEWSVNLDGKLYLFVVVDDQIRRVE